MVGQSGPLILDRNLQPVWFQPVPEKVVASNLSLQTYEGKPALAWWQGVVTNTGATESGEDVVVNQHYQTVARLKATDGWVLTLHEFLIAGEDAWVTANKNIPKDLSKLRRRLQRRADRLGRAGVQPEDRQAAAQLGRARPHPAGRLLRDAADQRLPLGRLPRQLDRPDRQRHVPRLDAQHLGRLPGRTSRPARSSGRSAASTRASSSARAPTSSGSTTSSCGPGSTVTHVRRPLLPADRRRHLRPADRALARARAASSTSSTHTATLVAQYGRGGRLRSRLHGRHAAAPNGNVFVGWGSEPYFSEYSTLRQAAVRRRTSRARPELPRDARAVGRPAADRARPAPRARRAARRRCTRAGTAPPRSSPGGSWPAPAPAGSTRRRRRAARSGFETAIAVPQRLQELRGAGARRRRPGDRNYPALRAGWVTRLRLDDESDRRRDARS